MSWTTKGRVRGKCGHNHRTVSTAIACLNRDRKGCIEQGGYSDRLIVNTETLIEYDYCSHCDTIFEIGKECYCMKVIQ